MKNEDLSIMILDTKLISISISIHWKMIRLRDRFQYQKVTSVIEDLIWTKIIRIIEKKDYYYIPQISRS